MWITPDGRVNTNAHANPADCVSESMMASLTTIAEREGESSIEVIDDGREDFYGLIDNDEIEVTSVTPGLDDQWLPDKYLDGSFATAAKVRDYIDTIPLDWRIEAYDVVVDLLEELAT